MFQFDLSGGFRGFRGGGSGSGGGGGGRGRGGVGNQVIIIVAGLLAVFSFHSFFYLSG